MTLEGFDRWLREPYENPTPESKYGEETADDFEEYEPEKE